MTLNSCKCSSVGRVAASKAECRGFESPNSKIIFAKKEKLV